MTCELCQTAGAVISPRHTSPRRCAFQDGTFNTSNYCCESLHAIVKHLEKLVNGSVFSDDEWIYILPVTGYELTVPGEEHPLDAICLIIHQYKSRGRFTGAWLILDHGQTPLKLTKELVDQIINRL